VEFRESARIKGANNNFIILLLHLKHANMKYTTEIRINLPRNRVIEYFCNAAYQQRWQPGLLSITLLEGEAGEEGARSELVYEGRKGNLLVTETISLKRLPEKYHVQNRSRGVYNEIENRFLEEEPGITLWQSKNTFSFRGMMMLMAPFMKQAFIQNTMLNMDRFKLFAENPEKVNFKKN
jgi:hypothetical protein